MLQAFFKKKDEDTKKVQDDFKAKEEELKNRENALRRKEEEATKKMEQLNKREEYLRKKLEDVKRREEEIEKAKAELAKLSQSQPDVKVKQEDEPDENEPIEKQEARIAELEAKLLKAKNILEIRREKDRKRKELSAKLESWANSGFDVERLKTVPLDDLENAEKEFASYEKNIERINVLKEKLSKVDTYISNEVVDLVNKMNNPDQINSIEAEAFELFSKVDNKRNELKAELESWKNEGYLVSKLEPLIEGDVGNAVKEFEKYSELIMKSAELKERLGKIEKSNEKEAKVIAEMIKDPEKISEAETKLLALEGNIAERQKKVTSAIENYKNNGYIVEILESAYAENLEKAEKTLLEYESNLERLKSLEEKVTKKIEEIQGKELTEEGKEALAKLKKLTAKLKDPTKATEFENEYAELESKLIIVEPAASHETIEIEMPVEPEKGKEEPKEVGTGLNKEYVFETFVVGDSNHFAHAAALAVAEAPATAYNPLFIYGGAGLGKTHLISAIGNRIKEQRPKMKVVYISTEKFTNELINAIQHDKVGEFRNTYRNVDVLIIDDIQFLAGKEKTQEEFFHTFNALHNAHKQIIISGDRPPKAIPTLEERLVSRFEWGLITDIQPPDLETRIAILRKKVQNANLIVPNEVIVFIATGIKNNIRELEGALNKVVAYSKLMKTDITLNIAKQVLKDVIKEEKPTPQVEEKKEEVKPEVKQEVKVEKVEQKEEKKELVLCPVCGKSVESTAKACPFCSTPLDLVPAKKIEQKEVEKKPEPKPEVKPEVKEEPKPEVKVEQKVEVKPEVKPEVKTEQPAATTTSDDPAKNATTAVENVEKYIKDLSTKGIDVTLANNLLRLAKSFMRSKNYEKAIQYAEKANAAAKDLEAKAGK